jgi:hypothetical protein
LEIVYTGGLGIKRDKILVTLERYDRYSKWRVLERKLSIWLYLLVTEAIIG